MNSLPSILIELKNLGHVPSFKNSKMITRGHLITKPERQKWMADATRSIESQLRSALATRGIATTTGQSALSSIALLLPLDDSRKWIPNHCVNTQVVSKGNEGADIKIERIR